MSLPGGAGPHPTPPLPTTCRFGSPSLDWMPWLDPMGRLHAVLLWSTPTARILRDLP
jgi:hypothetical protein